MHTEFGFGELAIRWQLQLLGSNRCRFRRMTIWSPNVRGYLIPGRGDVSSITALGRYQITVHPRRLWYEVNLNVKIHVV